MIKIWDLDGTLALNEHRQHFLEEKPKNWKAFNAACGDDKPNVPIIKLQQALHCDEQIILSGRSEEMKFDTIDWLQRHNIQYDGLYMRRKNDYRDDTEVKKDLFAKCMNDLSKRNIFCSLNDFIIFDDRQKVVDMWREMGLTCCQVAPGDF